MPPVRVVTSTVSPVAKSKNETLGVSSSGSPSCCSDGAPSSRVQLTLRLRRWAGDQLRPAPTEVSVPKSLNSAIEALALAVSRPRDEARLVTGKSRLAEPATLWRFRSDSIVTSSLVDLLSIPVEPAASLKVAFASPAGSANSGPFAVPSMPSVYPFERLRSRGSMSIGPRSPRGSRVGSPASSRAWASLRSGPLSVRLTLWLYSALPVDDRRHWPSCQLSAVPRAKLSLVERRVSGPSSGNARRISTPSSSSVPVGTPNRDRPDVRSGLGVYGGRHVAQDGPVVGAGQAIGMA